MCQPNAFECSNENAQIEMLMKIIALLCKIKWRRIWLLGFFFNHSTKIMNEWLNRYLSDQNNYKTRTMINEQFKTHWEKFDTDQNQSEKKGKEKRNDEQRERERWIENWSWIISSS